MSRLALRLDFPGQYLCVLALEDQDSCRLGARTGGGPTMTGIIFVIVALVLSSQISSKVIRHAGQRHSS